MSNGARNVRNAAIKRAPRSVAIARACSGLGRDIAFGLAEKGYRVFGTALTEAEVRNLKNSSTPVGADAEEIVRFAFNAQASVKVSRLFDQKNNRS
jgi:NADP-dependent 3-hydroxy acid dehydrogenase YdfG